MNLHQLTLCPDAGTGISIECRFQDPENKISLEFTREIENISFVKFLRNIGVFPKWNGNSWDSANSRKLEDKLESILNILSLTCVLLVPW